MTVKTKVWLASCVVAILFAAGCGGAASDAISSIASGSRPSGPGISFSPSISLPTDEASAPTEVPTEAPTAIPTEVPTEAPTTAPTEAPTTAPTEAPTTPPTEAPTTQPTEVPTESPTEAPSASPAGGAASTGTSAIWWVLGILLVAAIVAFLIMRSRRRPSTALQQAYAATAAVRDRLAQEVSTPSAAPGTLDALVDDADRALRAVEAAGMDEGTRLAVEQTLRAISDTRDGLALRSATTGAAHASGADVESKLLRALASLTAALGPLGQAVGAPPSNAAGFES